MRETKEMKEIKKELEKIGLEAARLATEDVQDALKEADLRQEESAKIMKNERCPS